MENLLQIKRKSLGITLRGMATELGIAPSYLSDIEKGKNTISLDLPEYIMSSAKVRLALRKARELATEEDWDDFVKKLNDKEGKT